jgi:hypothetical protein
MNYKQKLFLYFALIFGVFTMGVIIFEQSRDKKFRTQALEEKLDTYSEIIHASLQRNQYQFDELEELIRLFPQHIRASVINNDGAVQFDNMVRNIAQLANHANRPEIVEAKRNGKGTDIRISASNERKYLYYARKFGDGYIRVALPYDIHTQRLLKTDNGFLYFVVVLFAVMLLLMNMVAGRFGNSIRQLRDFVNASNKNEIPAFNFPKDELGEIGAKITDNYRQLNESRKKINLEREKLFHDRF